MGDRFRGWRFPLGVDPRTGTIKETDRETDIKQSILILLGTRPGERIGRPGYGCDLMRFTFENVSYGLIAEACAEIEDTLNRFEDRIESVSARPQEDNGNGRLAFTISYRIKETGRGGEVLYELDIG